MTLIAETKSVERIFSRGAAAVRALQGVEMHVEKGRLLVLKGRSGSGKTTLLNLLGGLDRPTSGSVYFEGREIGKLPDHARTKIRQKHMGFIFQSFGLLPLMSAAENVEFGLRLSGASAATWKERVGESLDFVGLSKRAQHRPFEMSGGEQQRCAIARAIASRPTLLLADEPTAELDSKTGLQISRLFRRLVDEGEMSIVMTTHDPGVMEVADDVYELEDGRIKTVRGSR
ncbi:ABC transporter ATP-binding protein [Brevibacillus sp. 1238]|uniref:ABC transporter ATP-binding protein n=1 Tax=Brevibacillus sp. 1238 TaxID=2940565 RepID=UPI002474182C|nr:ABC transporter ATP-binding protein [Brevibacillus sp. 1238]MDH6348212.1 putative ABC transport system ATP-binding protein [Brevibacillus sp. 1238]